MPAVRGSTFGYETTTSNAGVVVPVCPNSAGDLLVAVVMADTGALTTFTATMPTGWKLLQEWYNTTPMIAYMKIASGSDTDLDIAATTHATTNETYNGSMTSFRDVDQVTPVGVSTLSSYATSNQDSLQNVGDGTTTGVAQSFTTPAATANTNARGCFARAQFFLKKVGSPTGNAVAKIYAHSGTLGTSSVPTGAALATSTNVDVSTLTGTLTLTSFVFDEANWAQFTAGTNYVVALEYSGGDASNYVQAGYDASAPGHAGNKSTFNGSVWAAQSGHDVCFFAERFSFNMSNMSAAARTNMPTITTERDHSLVVFLGGGGGSAGTPSFVEGPVSQIHGSDGSAESHALGWAYQKAAGTSPSTVYCSMAVTGASVKGVLQVNPPTAGPSVVPAYCVSDLCSYIDPIAGTSAFNSNTALAATADTNFGTTIGSFTANDATVAAVTDVGINSFHSMGGVTNAATAGQVSGAELVIAAANRFNFSSKNLLAHVRFSTPAHSQRFPAADAGRGFWMGVRSNTASGGATTGWKVWQVHGVEAPWGKGDHIPIVINTGAGNTVGTSGTLDAAVVTSIGFWTSGIGTLTAQMCVGSVWLMDTTTVCGGNATEPLEVGGLVRVCATGKERVSARQQGAKQLLLLQEVQLGDGGTNTLYLDIDGAAIEFPRQYNLATGQINYNSIDNKVGITLYPGASDTCKVRNTILYSQSRYKFGLHASASTSATYDFGGTSIIGGGTLSFARAIAISDLTINDYVTLDVSDADLTTCTIKGAPAANDSLTTNSSTSFTGCTIDASGVTSGNRLCSVASPSIFSGCTFIGGGGHAIRITTPGTYTLTDNTWTGFGANGTNGAAIYNDSGGAVTLNVSGGTTPTYRNGSGASTTVNNAVTVKITVLDAATSAAVQNARVYMIADSGGDLSPGTVILNALSDASGVVQDTGFNYTSNQPVTGRVRKGPAAP